MKSKFVTAGIISIISMSLLFAGCGNTSTGTASPSAQTTAGSAAASSVSAAETAVASSSVSAAETAAASSAAPENANTQDQTAAAAAGQISLDEAKNTALTDAGLQESEVVYKKATLETDDDTGVAKYEIDFYAKDIEYEYDIEAATGAVIKSEKGVMDAEDYQEMELLQNQASGTANDTTDTASEEITEDSALDIALQDAGVAKGDVTASNVHLDYDDDTGMSKFDVEFYVGNTEYSYEINPETGEILESEVDIDD